MNLSGLFSIGATWAQEMMSSSGRSSRTRGAGTAGAGGGLSLHTGSAGSIAADSIRDRFRDASTALRAAFSSFTTRSKPVFTTSLSYTGAVARVSGVAARVNAIDDPYSTLNATLAVNTQGSTVRSSSSAIGLNTTAAASRLSSDALGLDLTSPDAASRLSSSAGLGLDVVSAQSASTIQSTGELTPATTSYGSSTLNFAGPGQPSTSVGTLTGTYTGVNTAAAATSLTVEVTNGTTLNPLLGSSIDFEVRDQAGTVLFSYSGSLRSGETVSLGADIGLSISFSTGALRNNHTASTTVTHTNNSVDGSALFNDANPALRPQFGGAQVTAGSFTVNGTSITVNADDSINAVLSRINASAAGVTATLDNDRITLTSNANSEEDIVLAGDSSGFLSATSLSAATTARGNIRDDQQVLAKTSQFGSVATGSFTVNGVSISLNKDTDSLESVLSRITASAANVTATFDSAQNKIVLTGKTNSQDLITVSGDTTGLLAAGQLATGNTVRGHLSEDTVAFSNLSGFSSVTTGSFVVDGQTIAVSSSDTIQSIVSKINSSGASVTAAFDAAANKLTLTTTGNSEDDVAIGSDTSGFLAAAGVSSGNTVTGNLADDNQVLSATPEFSGVTNGSFSVNGVSISVNAGTDTLQSIVSRVNSAGAGVTASYDGVADRLVFTPDVAGATLALESDTSGFLAAANVATGTTGVRVNADGAFNATGLSGPQFDPGLSVQAGGFSVNGVAINVAADDTLTTVLAKITASAAGVTATYDAATEKVTLASNSGTDPITVTGDTSGFLAAVKLDGTAQAAVAPRTLSAFGTAFGAIAEYSSVQAGTLTVNGNQIAIDPATTTARSLVSALNATADVTATLDETTGAITIAAREMGGTMTVADTSGLLAALGINAGTYTGAVASTKVVETQTGTVAVTNSTEVAAKAAAAIQDLNAAVKATGADAAGTPAFGADVQAALQDALDSLSAAGMKGLSLTGQGGDAQVTADADALAASLNGFASEAELDAVVQRVVGRFTEQLAESAAKHASEPAAGDQAKQMLAVEHTQAALLSLAPIRPRTPDAAARIRSAAPDLRSADWKRVDTAELEESRPRTLPRTDPLRSMLDLFAERPGATTRPWWRW